MPDMTAIRVENLIRPIVKFRLVASTVYWWPNQPRGCRFGHVSGFKAAGGKGAEDQWVEAKISSEPE